MLPLPVVLPMSAEMPLAVLRGRLCCYRAPHYRWPYCVAGCVAEERINTGGRVVAAGCVAKERFKTVGRVVAAGCVVPSA